MKNTNWIWSVATLGALVTLSACGDSNAGEDSQEISFGATAGPYSDMLTKAIVPGLEEKGYSVTINEYQDYIIQIVSLPMAQMMQIYFSTKSI